MKNCGLQVFDFETSDPETSVVLPRVVCATHLHS